MLRYRTYPGSLSAELPSDRFRLARRLNYWNLRELARSEDSGKTLWYDIPDRNLNEDQALEYERYFEAGSPFRIELIRIAWVASAREA